MVLIDRKAESRAYKRFKNAETLSDKMEEWRCILSRLDNATDRERLFYKDVLPWFDEKENKREKRHVFYRDNRDFGNIEAFDRLASEQIRTEVDYVDAVLSYEKEEMGCYFLDKALSAIVKSLTKKQRDILYRNVIENLSTQEIAIMEQTTDRNIRKILNTALTHIRGQILPVIAFKHSLTHSKKWRHIAINSGIDCKLYEIGWVAAAGEEYEFYYKDKTFSLDGIREYWDTNYSSHDK